MKPLTFTFSVITAMMTPIHADAEKAGIIDAHFHAKACTHDGLEQARTWMDANGVTRIIDHPLADSRPKNETEREAMLANYKKHVGKIEHFCIIKPEEVQTLEEAVKILEQEKRDGAIGFGEHYGTGLMFDDPKCMLLYEACGKVGLPVMFHMDDSQNKDTADFKHLANALKSYPNCKFIAHGPNWWKQMAAGDCDRMLESFTNLYADLSAGSGARALSKDLKQTTAFLIKHRSKLLFGSDCGWWSFNEGAKPAPQFALMKSLDLPDDVKADIYKGNAMRLFGFKVE